MFARILTISLIINFAIASYVPPTTSVRVCPRLDDCSLNCKFGYAVAEDGCEVCECQDRPCSEDGKECRLPTKFETDEKNCNETDTCDLVVTPGSCPDITCQSFCRFGFVKNSAGCEICKCMQNPCKESGGDCSEGFTCVPKQKNTSCEWTPTCVPACPQTECTCEKGHRRDENDCRTCNCKKDYCDGIKCPDSQLCIHDPKTRDFHSCVCARPICDLSCPFGLARDRNGCQICKCVTDPCQFVTCRNDLTCVPIQNIVCLEKPCPFKAKCKRIS